MANNCEICGKAFGTTNPRTFVQNHAICKTCKTKVEAMGSFEKAKESIEAEILERQKREEEERLERQKREEEAAILEELRLKKLNEELSKGKKIAEEEIANHKNSPLIFSLEGSRGKHMDVYPDKCVITTSVTLGSVITGNATDGEKTIYYSDVIALQWKKSFLTLGYIQLETASRQMNNGDSNFSGENSFVYDGSSETTTDETATEVVNYIKCRIDSVKQAILKENFSSPADEILKYKNLLDIGAITSDEYEAKKKQLLDL